ncbi:FAD:protein FMN transferase [Micromonospora sp. NBC_00898]|uniref:FAD:protein FMN transferase n=1 Tax=Micromonospora sp. NBC_00898 TaxID=2975981 RepID=UPI00386BE3F2|nr:FAD:protein FMN transferase [Micromonospora sp. NBC_00898]
MSLNGTFEVRWWWRGRPVRVAVTQRTVLPTARRAVAGRLAALRTAEAELARAHHAAGRPVPVGPLLRDLVAVALGAAEASGDAVDPTIGAARLRGTAVRGPLPVCGAGVGSVGPAADWRAVALRGERLAVPPPRWLDLGGTATAYLVQRCAEQVAARHRTGVLVAVGSRIAAAGPAPEGGWPVAVDGGPVALAGGALVTADGLRADGGGVRDPRTGGAPASPWTAVTVAAPDAARAAMLAVAALVRDADGPRWLAGQGVRAWPVARPAALPQPATRW